MFFAISRLSSSWDTMSCTPKIPPWIWGATCYDWAKRKDHYGAPGRDRLRLAPVGWIIAAAMAGHMEAVDSTAGTCFRSAHRAAVCMARTPLQPPREKPVPMTGGRRSQMHTKGGTTSKGQWLSRQAALRREQLEDSSVRPKPRRRKAGRRRNSNKCRPRHGVKYRSRRGSRTSQARLLREDVQP
jgi:hypothetical protein